MATVGLARFDSASLQRATSGRRMLFAELRCRWAV